MNINIEELKKKIIYRAQYRGTKEMDKLMSSFVKMHIDKFDIKNLKDLEKLLEIDDNNLYSFYNGTNTRYIFEDNNVNRLFKNFTLKK
jgi:antitoxin CptB|tara:strand:- start:597 stop:860 length:264 start_codon:yes stop_codon:yes gene_type:complete